MSKSPILIIDGNQSRRSRLRELLEGLDHTVLEATSLQQLGKNINHHQMVPLIVHGTLLDEAGKALIDQLRQQHSTMSVIVVSPRKATRSWEPAIGKIIDGWVPESPTATELSLVLNQLMRLSQFKEQTFYQKQKATQGQQFYDSLLNSSSEAIVVINQDFEIQYANRRFGEFTGKKPEDILGKHLHEYLEDGFKLLNHIYQQLTIGKVPGSYRVNIKSNQNRIFDVNLRADFRTTSRGYIEGLIVTMENRTLQEEACRQLLRKERIDLIQKLANAFAHEIQNPTHILSGRIQLLHKELEDERHSHSFEVINRQISRISSLVSKMQKFNYNREDTIPEVFALIEFLEDYLVAFEKKNAVEFQLQYQPKEKHILIQANRFFLEDAFEYLFQIIANLVQVQPISIHCHLIRSHSAQASLEVQVDLGDIDIQENIFEPFENLISNDSFSMLDLALIHAILSNYDGKIFIDTHAAGRKLLKIHFLVAGMKNIDQGTLNNMISEEEQK